jgi:pectin methylesterase-like acyl-CoA thioesterase
VNPGGTGGCFSTIGAAVAAAAKNDTIQVAAGVYNEDVIIGKPLSLVGAGRSSTIINAKGLANGVYVDGLDNPGLKNVTVLGFTMKNANFEGVLVTNASYVTIAIAASSPIIRALTLRMPPAPAFRALKRRKVLTAAKEST